MELALGGEPDMASKPRMPDAWAPFRVEVPDAKLAYIRERVRTYPWDAWSEPQDAESWAYGPPASFMRRLCDYWVEGFDWREQERLMNLLPHFTTPIDDVNLHFVHERGSGANPTPLLIAHGWPYSFHSYSGLVDQLADPERHGGRVEDAFTVILPSYPGYDFSSRPLAPMGPRAVAFMFDSLMQRLGYDRYLVHGGDWGAHITSLLGFYRPARVAGIHSTGLALREAGAEQLSGEVPPGADDEARAFIAEEHAIWQLEGAYSNLHATKPAKLGYAMLDSPVGVAAWIVEAFHAWSDRRDRSFEDLFSFDQLLTEVMLYLVTDAFSPSTWIYGAKKKEEATLPPGRRVEVPTALAAFPDPVFPMPPRAMAEKSHNVVRYTVMAGGGHYPFYEAPHLLVDDLRAFRRDVMA
jgi:pimeloyl-ACP methyl ester carboxylesterase